MSLKAIPVPSTLAEAHEVLARVRPRVDAGPQVWVEFHRNSAAVYAEIAKLDAGHQHEANHCAGVELRQAREIEDGLIGD